MRKLLALFVMLAVLGACAPSYGYILVYKVTISYKTVVIGDDVIAKGTVNGSLVVNINDSNEIADAEFVLYGKVGGEKKYEPLNITDYTTLTLVPESGSENIAAITIGADGGTDYRANLFGNLKKTNISPSEKKWIPTALSGGMLMNGQFFSIANLIGSSTISATLDSKSTKTANATPETFSEVVDGIVTALENKGYQQILVE